MGFFILDEHREEAAPDGGEQHQTFFGGMMAKITKVTMIDDLDGTESEDVREVRFSLDGDAYEIDLAPANVEALTAALEPFVKAARPVRDAQPRKASRIVRSRSEVKAAPSTIRAWAAANGIEVAPRGRLNAKVVEQYEAAQSA